MTPGPPVGLAPDFGGPDVLSMGELAQQRLEVTGGRTRLVPVPACGFRADSEAGRHLSPEPSGRHPYLAAVAGLLTR